MSSIKCPNCGLTNFSTTHYCKRCNAALAQNSNDPKVNETRILNDSYNTGVRSTMPENNFYNEPKPYQQDYRQNQNQSRPNYQQPPSNNWTLPQFPKGQRPANNNRQYQQRQYQPHNPYFVNEPQFRRFGSEVALHQNANLPGYCVKCGKHISTPHDGEYVSQKFRWHNPLVYIALISPIIYLILALCLSKTFTVNIPLCNEHLQKRETSKHIVMGGSLSAFALIVLCSIFGAVELAFLVFLVALIALPIVFEYAYKPLQAKNIQGNYYHLGGASQEFLDTIPY